MRNILQKLGELLRVVRADEIARRYFVLNAFDGALTTLGITMGAYFAGVQSAKIVLVSGLGASIAMGLSGAWGSYMSEGAERARKVKELESAMFTTLQDSVIGRASRKAVILVTAIDALAPLATALLCLLPILFSLYGFVPLGAAVSGTFTITVAILFALGVFLGRVARSNIWVHGGLMVLAALFIVAASYFIGTG